VNNYSSLYELCGTKQKERILYTNNKRDITMMNNKAGFDRYKIYKHKYRNMNNNSLTFFYIIFYYFTYVVR
jgi:hypothetical protein